VVATEQDRGFAERRPGVRRAANAPQYAHHRGIDRGQALRHRAGLGERSRGRDDPHQDLAGGAAGADDQLTQQAFPGPRVKERQAALLHETPRRFHQANGKRRPEVALSQAQDVVPSSARVQPERAVRMERELHLVPVVELGGRRLDGAHGQLAEPRESRQAVAHDLGLRGQLRGVGHVLPAAAAAPLLDVRTAGLHPAWGCGLDGHEVGLGVSAVRPANPRAHPLVGRGALDEDRETVGTGHARPAVGEAFHVKRELVTGTRPRATLWGGAQRQRPRRGDPPT